MLGLAEVYAADLSGKAITRGSSMNRALGMFLYNQNTELKGRVLLTNIGALIVRIGVLGPILL